MTLNMDWMRQTTVNILKYLPDFLSKDINFKAVGNACSKEHEEIRLQLQDIFNQFFISTATWGLAYYEEILDLTPDKNDTYDQRRNRIFLKYQSNQSSTIDFMTTLAKKYFSDAATISISESNSNYAFRLIADAVSYDIDGLVNAMNIYKPAHLALIIVHFLSSETNMYYGGLVQECANIEIEPTLDFAASISDSSLYGAGIVQASGIITILKE